MHLTTKAKTADLLNEYKTANEERQSQIEGEIVDLNTPMIISRMKVHNIPAHRFDDFLQEGRIAVMKAVRKFDPSRGWVFSTFAVTTIDGVLCNAYRDHEWVLTVPRPDKEKGIKLVKKFDPLESDTQHLTPEEVARLHRLIYAQYTIDLDVETMNDMQAPPSDMAETETIMSTLILNQCSSAQADLLHLHFVEGYTVHEIAFAALKTIEEIGSVIQEALQICQKNMPTLQP